jgi:hypothetical protein
MSLEAWATHLATVMEWFAKEKADDALLVAAYDSTSSKFQSDSLETLYLKTRILISWDHFYQI